MTAQVRGTSKTEGQKEREVSGRGTWTQTRREALCRQTCRSGDAGAERRLEKEPGAVQGPEGRAAADRAAGVTGPGPGGRGVTPPLRQANRGKQSAGSDAGDDSDSDDSDGDDSDDSDSDSDDSAARACAHEPAAAEKPTRVCMDGGSSGPRPPPTDGELRGGSPLPGLQDPRGPQRTPWPPAHPAPSTRGQVPAPRRARAARGARRAPTGSLVAGGRGVRSQSPRKRVSLSEACGRAPQ